MSLDDYTVKIKEIAIEGKLVTLSATLSDLERTNFFTDKEFINHTKNKLAAKLAEYIVNNKLIEFVYNQSHVDLSTTITCRAYLAPDSQIKILRVYEK